MKLEQILRDSPYALSCFAPPLVERLEKSICEKHGGNFFAPCLVRGKDIPMKPEEVVRQLLLMDLTKRYGYPLDLLKVEYPVTFGGEGGAKRADVVIIDQDNNSAPYIIAEVKKPRARKGREQLRSYCNATGAPMGIWTNGSSIAYFHRREPNHFEEIRDIPNARQQLADVLQRQWTLKNLAESDTIAAKGRSLREVVEELEDEVLANSGEDVFEEVFKLIYAKLYDEWVSSRDNHTRETRNLEFYNSGHSETQLMHKIQELFNNARDQWPGVFQDNSEIKLKPPHLAICVSSLSGVKLLNSNLDVVDDAFEYLVSKASRGEKGQYFTPRHVIDMCVKMLDPEENEHLIDTAAGSAGFPIHAVFHVWQKIFARLGKQQSHLFANQRKPPACDDYVQKRIFAIDFDAKATLVARALNVIAGDGSTNVLQLNALDYKKWEKESRNETWQDINQEGFRKLRQLRAGGRADKGQFRDFKFDIVMANPPFAGDIRESAIIHLYELGVKTKRRRSPSSKTTAEREWYEKMPRHVMFIERNLQFLKPGGRMAVVLPQGTFSNATDDYIRKFIADRARILAVVGLPVNTFKPHTGTKTSVLLVQKWNDDPKSGPLCRHRDDYPIFFAVAQKPGKDNSGKKIYVRHPDNERGRPTFLLDAHGHLIVDHDLFNLRAHHFPEGINDEAAKALDCPGIAEAFAEFAKREKLSFAKKK